jgi:predicted dehydrogenase
MEAGQPFNMDKKKILFFGLGSIGSRHASLLQENFDVELTAYRTGSSGNTLNIPEFNTLEDAFNFAPDIAFITNPTNLHIDTAIECAKRSINLFIEKPLSNTTDGVSELVGLIKENRLVNHVAFCMRFHPVIKYLKSEIDMTEAFYARTICSSYFPAWRPNQDYRKSYSADRKRGGGVINELVHELDYNEYLFGELQSMTVNTGQISPLEISAEDFAEFDLIHSGDKKGHISLDYFSHKRDRTIKIYFPDKMIEADVINQTVSTYQNHECVDVVNIDDENMYLNQLNAFFNSFEGNGEDLCSVEESTNIVTLISDL